MDDVINEPDARQAIAFDHVEIVARTREGERALVKDFSVAVAPGEVVGLIGESGSGKTTAARAAIGLLDHNVRVTAGSISVEGTVVHSAEVNRCAQIRGRDVGMVFQSAVGSLDPLMRVGRQVNEVIRAHYPSLGKPEVLARARAVMASMGFDDVDRVLRAFPHELSGGMAQRVGIALAIVTDPAVVIADECTSALDVTTQAGVIDVLGNLASRGTGLLFVTHDLLLAGNICDRIAVMFAGELVEIGPVLDVLESPQHDYTRELLAAVPDPHRNDFSPGTKFALSA